MGEDRPSDLQRYADNTTIHGVKDFVSSRSKVLKVIWGLFLLAAAGLLCEEVYRSAMNYQSEPTSFDTKMDPLEKYPTIHVWVSPYDWFDSTSVRSLGLQDQEIAYLCWYFASQSPECTESMFTYTTEHTKPVEHDEEGQTSLKKKMKVHNLTTVGDMLKLITVNMSATIDGQVVGWSSWYSVNRPGEVCYSITNVTFTTPQPHYSIQIVKQLRGVLVVGEDPFSRQQYEFDNNVKAYTIGVWDVNKITLVNKRRDYCNNKYESREVCMSDCDEIKKKCTCNRTSPVVFPYEDEDFWFIERKFDGCHMLDNSSLASCDQVKKICEEKCNPCTIWGYQYSVRTQQRAMGGPTPSLNLTFNDWVPRMKLSTEYFTYPPSSLVSNIGGLMGLFCGASLLSFVQAAVFCCDDGCRSKKINTLETTK